MNLLSISDRYCFSEIREAAIMALTPLKDNSSELSPIEKLRMALRFKISHWLEPVYVEIVKGADSLSAEDLEGLPLDTIALLTRCRERYHEYSNRALDSLAFKNSAEEIVRGELGYLGINQ